MFVCWFVCLLKIQFLYVIKSKLEKLLKLCVFNWIAKFCLKKKSEFFKIPSYLSKFIIFSVVFDWIHERFNHSYAWVMIHAHWCTFIKHIYTSLYNKNIYIYILSSSHNYLFQHGNLYNIVNKKTICYVWRGRKERESMWGWKYIQLKGVITIKKLYDYKIKEQKWYELFEK